MRPYASVQNRCYMQSNRRFCRGQSPCSHNLMTSHGIRVVDRGYRAEWRHNDVRCTYLRFDAQSLTLSSPRPARARESHLANITIAATWAKSLGLIPSARSPQIDHKFPSTSQAQQTPGCLFPVRSNNCPPNGFKSYLNSPQIPNAFQSRVEL